MTRVGLVVLTLSLFLSSRAHAQDSGEAPARARSDNLSETRDGGWFLVSFGAASVAGGGITSGIGHDDPLVLWTGVWTMAWGAVNVLLGLTLVDLDGSAAREIARDRSLTGDALARMRDDQVSRNHRQAAMFALNTGLDVGYVVTGILIAVLASQSLHEEWLEGFGIAMATQGAVLLPFDFTEWVQSADRAARITAVR